MAPTPATAQPRPEPAWRRLIKALVRGYMRVWHRLEIDGQEHLPPSGPLLVLLNHASLLDVPALVAADPYPNTVALVKASLFRLPLVRDVLRAWPAIPVERHGRDLGPIRAIFGALRQGMVVAVAAEGRRTRSGCLQPINPVLARIALSARVPIVPIGVVGTFAALPPGAHLPRRLPVRVNIGRPFSLPPDLGEDEAARRIYDALAALLPPEQLPPPEPETAVAQP